MPMKDVMAALHFMNSIFKSSAKLKEVFSVVASVSNHLKVLYKLNKTEEHLYLKWFLVTE
jgi:hypothetical protein